MSLGRIERSLDLTFHPRDRVRRQEGEGVRSRWWTVDGGASPLIRNASVIGTGARGKCRWVNFQSRRGERRGDPIAGRKTMERNNETTLSRWLLPRQSVYGRFVPPRNHHPRFW